MIVTYMCEDGFYNVFLLENSSSILNGKFGGKYYWSIVDSEVLRSGNSRFKVRLDKQG